ncbi:MAG: hypothetical protein ACJ747_10855 [Gaiellaceae bacterium]|jgi:hypothetical protein
MAPPEWTDWTQHDPGITLLELFAYLGEGLDYAVSSRRRRRTFALVAAAVAWLAWRRRCGGRQGA